MSKTKAFGLIFVGFVLCHWTTAGQDEIVNGTPTTPVVSVQQDSSK